MNCSLALIQHANIEESGYSDVWLLPGFSCSGDSGGELGSCLGAITAALAAGSWGRNWPWSVCVGKGCRNPSVLKELKSRNQSMVRFLNSLSCMWWLLMTSF